MSEIKTKIDAAAEQASAEAAEKLIAAKLAEETPSAVKPRKLPKALKSAAGNAPAGDTAEIHVPVVPVQADTVSAAPAAPAPASVSKLSQLKDKIMATAPNTADFAAKVQDTAADMQSRAKVAYEKTAEMTADMTAFHKGNLDAIVESGKVLAASMQDLGRNAVEDAKLAAETVTADLKAMVAVKSPTELFQLQGEIARRNLDTMVARTSKNAEVMMKLANDMFAPISTRASVAMERFNKAA